MLKLKDFEDCLLAESSKSNKCEGVVTRDSRDFQDFEITLYSLEEIILKLAAQENQ